MSANPSSFDHRVCGSGLQICTLQQDVPWVRLALFVRYAGHLYDPIGKEGTAHLLEHVMHSGTHGVPYEGYSGLTDWVDEQGFWFPSASTHPDYMRFPLVVKADELAKGMDFLCRFVSSPSYQGDLETDREIVRRERVKNAPGPRQKRITQAYEAAFSLSSHRLATASGLPEDDVLNAITRDDIIRCHEGYFHPPNMALIAVGKTTSLELERLLSKHLPLTTTERVEVSPVEPPVLGPPLTREARFAPVGQGEVVSVSLRYRWIYPFDSTPNGIVTKNILQRELTNALRERLKITYGVQVTAFSAARLLGGTYIGCVIKPEDETNARRAIETVLTDYDAIPQSLVVSMRGLETDFYLAEPSAFNLIDGTWDRLLEYGRPRADAERISALRSVSPSDVVAFMKERLDPANAYIEAIESL